MNATNLDNACFLLIGDVADIFSGVAGPHLALRHHCAGQHDGTGGDNHVVTDLAAFLDNRALTNKHLSADCARGDKSTVANGHLLQNCQSGKNEKLVGFHSRDRIIGRGNIWFSTHQVSNLYVGRISGVQVGDCSDDGTILHVCKATQLDLALVTSQDCAIPYLNQSTIAF